MDLLPLSLLNDYLYCHRRAALKVVEGWRSANVNTERGDIVHEHADLAGYEVAKGVKLCARCRGPRMRFPFRPKPLFYYEP